MACRGFPECTNNFINNLTLQITSDLGGVGQACPDTDPVVCGMGCIHEMLSGAFVE